MPENEKKKNIEDEESKENVDKPSRSEDQKRRSYYYDDACGYEIYEADEDEKDS